MPRTRPHANSLSGRGAIVLSCEHAGHAVPKAYRHLFAADPSVLATHRGYDIGIAPVARQVATMLGLPLTACHAARLLIEVNRSLHHRNLFSQFSRDLPTADKRWLIDRIWRSHREAVTKSIATHIRNGKRVLHLSLHSFTPILDGHRRIADIGLLYDPQRKAEKDVAMSLRQTLQETTNLRIRRNYPYRGNADGLTTALRQAFSSRDYLGLEIELNQALLAPTRPRSLAKTLAETIARTWRS